MIIIKIININIDIIIIIIIIAVVAIDDVDIYTSVYEVSLS